MLKNKKGESTLSVVAGVVVSMIIISGTLILYNNVVQKSGRDIRFSRELSNIDSLLGRFTQDVHSSKDALVEDNGYTLSLATHTNTEVVYKIEEDYLFRNEDKICYAEHNSSFFSIEGEQIIAEITTNRGVVLSMSAYRKGVTDEE